MRSKRSRNAHIETCVYVRLNNIRRYVCNNGSRLYAVLPKMCRALTSDKMKKHKYINNTTRLHVHVGHSTELTWKQIRRNKYSAARWIVVVFRGEITIKRGEEWGKSDWTNANRIRDRDLMTRKPTETFNPVGVYFSFQVRLWKMYTVLFVFFFVFPTFAYFYIERWIGCWVLKTVLLNWFYFAHLKLLQYTRHNSTFLVLG